LKTFRLLAAAALCAAAVPPVAAQARTGSSKLDPVCYTIQERRNAIDKEMDAIRAQIAAAPRKGDGDNVKNMREMIKLMPQAFGGGKAAKAIEEARKMDDGDWALSAEDRASPGQKARLDGLRKEDKVLEQKYDNNPGCFDKAG
jgi:hypothetical protein